MTMLPRLQAEETLAAATVVGLGSGTIAKREAQRVVGELRRQAKPGPAPRAGIQALAMMGIAVEHV